MGFAFLILGLLPLMFLPESIDTDDLSDEFADESGGIDALQPMDEDDQPDDSSQNPNPDNILQPIDEIDEYFSDESAVDDEAYYDLASSDGDQDPADEPDQPLLPVDQIESEAPEIWINFGDDAGLGYSEIEDFDADVDVVHVSIDPDAVIGELDVEVIKTDNGEDAQVYVEEQLIAVLKGAPNATIANVIVEIAAINS
jgi:hypothetical protein